MYKRLYEEEHKHNSSYSPTTAIAVTGIFLPCCVEITSYSILSMVCHMGIVLLKYNWLHG